MRGHVHVPIVVTVFEPIRLSLILVPVLTTHEPGAVLLLNWGMKVPPVVTLTIPFTSMRGVVEVFATVAGNMLALVLSAHRPPVAFALTAALKPLCSYWMS
jgi:hypothetical protein